MNDGVDIFTEQDFTRMILITYGIALIVMIIIMIPYFIGMWKLYEKAGEKGWKCLIPIYNNYILYEIVYGNGWKYFLTFVPVLNIVMPIALVFRIAEVFGKGTEYGVGLLFIPYIFILILAFDESEYQGAMEDVFI